MKAKDPFNPKDGVFSSNIRLPGEGSDLDELRESMRRWGWHPECPAIADERGVTLVGHRRMQIAKELGIEPIIKHLTFGTGDAADAERTKLAIVTNIGFKPMTAKDRKHIAEHLYGERNWTMQRIAEALNVATDTIHRDLGNFPTAGKLKHAKTGSNPKGAGRPKAVRPTDKLDKARTAVAAKLDAGKAVNGEKLAKEIGVSRATVDTAAAQEKGRREALAEPRTERSDLSLSAQHKFDIAVRRMKEQLDAQFEQRVKQESSRRMREMSLPAYSKEWAELRILLEKRRGWLSRVEYRKILACLHPDSRKSVSDARLAEAFGSFEKLEIVLVAEKELPTQAPDLPSSYEEWAAKKSKVSAERKAKRSSGSSEMCST